jgi:phosphatidylglycerol lysyltransferase
MLSTSTGLASLAWTVLFAGGERLARLPVPAWMVYLALALTAAYLPLYLLLLGSGLVHRRLLKGIPPLRLGRRLLLIGISLLDYGLGALSAWTCLWAAGALASPMTFMVAFVLAAALGTFSLLPGGLGVFDGVLWLALSSQGLPSAPVLAGIMLYRLVYYLVPWVIGIYLGTGVLVTADNAWLAGLARRWEESALLAVLRIPLHLLSALGVRVLSALTFIAGAALLLSAVFPTLAERAALLETYAPLAAIEGSHLLSVVTGVLLIGLSRGIASQVRSAYRLAMGLLLAGVLFSLLRGIHVEVALFLLLVTGLLRLRKQDFYRVAYPLRSLRNLYWLARAARRRGVLCRPRVPAPWRQCLRPGSARAHRPRGLALSALVAFGPGRDPGLSGLDIVSHARPAAASTHLHRARGGAGLRRDLGRPHVHPRDVHGGQVPVLCRGQARAHPVRNDPGPPSRLGRPGGRSSGDRGRHHRVPRSRRPL